MFFLFVYFVTYLYHLARWPRAWNCSCLYRLAKWPCAISVTLAFVVAFETALTWRALNCVTSDKSLSLRDWKSDAVLRTYRRYGRLFLRKAGLLVWICCTTTCCMTNPQQIEASGVWAWTNFCGLIILLVQHSSVTNRTVVLAYTTDHPQQWGISALNHCFGGFISVNHWRSHFFPSPPRFSRRFFPFPLPYF